MGQQVFDDLVDDTAGTLVLGFGFGAQVDAFEHELAELLHGSRISASMATRPRLQDSLITPSIMVLIQLRP